ncbi:hypothetical protein ACFV2N_47440 [Streptomyces sp. NPDC059680]|uniref:hypothetical protein n=1 Tax=Streptomyces sp. NPDC059680 TaxID=3346904 RepID=UPI0036B5AA22
MEASHVSAGLCDDHLDGTPPDARDRFERLKLSGKSASPLDPHQQRVDGRPQLIDAVRVRAAPEGVVVTEFSGQPLG